MLNQCETKEKSLSTLKNEQKTLIFPMFCIHPNREMTTARKMQGKESWRSENMKGDKEAKDILGNANER